MAAGACAAALAGCTSSDLNGNARVLVAQTTLNANNQQVTAFSDAATDPLRQAKIDRDLNATPNDPTDDTVTVTVDKGNAISGPKEFAYNSSIGIVANNGGYAFAGFTPTDVTDQSILIAGATTSGYSFAGLEVAQDSATSATVGAGYGGTAPSGNTPSGTVTYTGAAIGASETTGNTSPVAFGGTSSIVANFTGGTVTGTLNFSGTSNDVGFSGTMSSNNATYTGSSFTLGGSSATGQVVGGFFGPNYVETAGAFDVQNGNTKVGGAFGGQLP